MNCYHAYAGIPLVILVIIVLECPVFAAGAFSIKPDSPISYYDKDTITLPWTTTVHVKDIRWCYWQYAAPGTDVWEQFLGYDYENPQRLNITSQSRFWHFQNNISPCLSGIYSLMSGEDRGGKYQMHVIATNGTKFESPTVEVNFNETEDTWITILPEQGAHIRGSESKTPTAFLVIFILLLVGLVAVLVLMWFNIFPWCTLIIKRKDNKSEAQDSNAEQDDAEKGNAEEKAMLSPDGKQNAENEGQKDTGNMGQDITDVSFKPEKQPGGAKKSDAQPAKDNKKLNQETKSLKLELAEKQREIEEMKKKLNEKEHSLEIATQDFTAKQKEDQKEIDTGKAEVTELKAKYGLLESNNAAMLRCFYVYMKVLKKADHTKYNSVPPSFKEKPDNVLNCKLGKELKLEVVVTGFPRPFILWKRGNIIVKEENGIKFHYKKTDKTSTFGITIPNMTKELAGTYICIAGNDSLDGVMCQSEVRID